MMRNAPQLYHIDWKYDVPQRAREQAAKGLTLAAAHLKGAAAETCPRMEGTLMRSGTVKPATPENLESRFGYGGAASAYALYQHEMQLDHSRSNNPKARRYWLKLSLAEQAQAIRDIVAKSISEGWDE